VTVVDTTTHDPVGTIAVAEYRSHPDEYASRLVASPDGHRLYVISYDELVVLNVDSRSVELRVELAPSAPFHFERGLAVSPDGSRVFLTGVAAEDQEDLGPDPSDPHQLFDGLRVLYSDKLRILSTASFEELTSFVLPWQRSGDSIALSPDGHVVFIELHWYSSLEPRENGTSFITFTETAPLQYAQREQQSFLELHGMVSVNVARGPIALLARGHSEGSAYPVNDPDEVRIVEKNGQGGLAVPLPFTPRISGLGVRPLFGLTP